MTKIKGMCRNEDCEMCDQIQEAEKSNFKCEKCGKDLIPFGNKISDPKGPNTKLIGIIAGAVAVLAIIGGIIAFSGGSEEKPVPAPVPEVKENTDSIKAAQEAAEQQRIKDSLDAVDSPNILRKDTNKISLKHITFCFIIITCRHLPFKSTWKIF